VTEEITGTQTCQSDCTWGSCVATCPSDQCTSNSDCQKCGNGTIDPGEACEPPNSNNNTNCSQSTSYCNYSSRKYCTRDSYGNCNSSCQCVADPWNCGNSDDSSYCSNCSHCGDGVCNCGETSSSCSSDCGTSNQPPLLPSLVIHLNALEGSGNSSCIMYQPTSDIDPCIFKLVNNSSDPDGSISQTKWYIKKKGESDSSYREIDSCSGKCNHTIQITDVPDPATYTVKLYVEDNQGASASVTRDLRVKREISAGFMCSLDNSNWKSCETIKVLPGQTIYLKDDPSLTEHSIPSEGATINSRIWQKGDGVNFETFSQNTENASTTLNPNQRILRLIVSDTASRSDRQDHQVSVTYPPPFWREIPPIFFRVRRFLASLFRFK